MLRTVLFTLIAVLVSAPVFAAQPTPDTVAPVLDTAVITNGGTELQLIYTEENSLDTTAPAATDFTITAASSGAITVNTVTVNADNTITLSLTGTVLFGDTVTLDYTPGTNPIQDGDSNLAAALVVESVSISVLGYSSTHWTPISPSGGSQFDYFVDQQTGQGDGDIVGDGGLNPGFQVHFDDNGSASNTDGTLSFRFRIAKEGSNYYMVGIDADLDGAIDVYIRSDTTNSPDVEIVANGTGLNISPSTSDLGGVLSTDFTPVVNSVAVTSIDTSATVDLDGAGDPDVYVNVSLPFAELVSALGGLGITLTDADPLRYAVATSVNGSTFNQDIAGLPKDYDAAATYVSSGAFSDPVNMDGSIAPVQPGTPVINDLAGDTLAYVMNDGPSIIDQSTVATITDSNDTSLDDAGLLDGSLHVEIAVGAAVTEDVLGITEGAVNGATVALSTGYAVNSVVSVDGIAIGTITDIGAGTGVLDPEISFTVTFDQLVGNATLAKVDTLIQAVTYVNTNMATATEGARTVSFLLSDGAFNTEVSTSVSVTQVADITAPLAPTVDLLATSDSGASSTDNITNDSTPTIRVTFDQTGGAATDTVVGDVVKLFNGATEVGTVTVVAGDIINGYVEITSSLLSEGSLSFTATVTDISANASSASTALPVSLQTSAPSVAVTLGDSALIKGETTLVTFTFSTAPTGFVEADDVTVANGALSGFTVTADPAVYTATFTPTDNLEDPTNVISVGTGYTDGSGNTGTAGTSANYTIDTLAPTVAVTLADAALSKGETSLVTFTFSEVPTGFAVGDVTADNGGLTLFTVTGNPLVYTATFTPTDSINDPSNVISVATTYTDGSGNTGTAGTSGNYTINTVAPSVAVTMGDNALSKGESTLVTFTFSTAPTGFVEADDVTVQNGALSGFTVTGDPAVYTATFTPTDNLEDPTNTISVGTGYTDGSGNTGTAGTSANYTIDTLAPTVAVTLADAALSKGETSLVTFTFSEAPTGFAVGDVTADNGGLTLFTVTGNPLVYTATFTPTDSINDPSNVISVATTYTDGSGNTGTAGTSGNYTINTVAPSVAVTMGDNALSKGESTLVTFTFSTAPTGFVEADDVTVQNGALSGFTVTGDPAVYTATFTPTDNLEDPTNTISVGTGYTDGSGNTGTAGTSANYTIDTLAPTVAVTLADAALSKGETSLVTFTFSEAPTGFAVGDVTADNGGLTLFTVTGNPLVYTATFTPTDSINDPSNVISVATTYTDGSGNTGTAGTSGNYTINTVAPSVAVTMGDNALSKGESTLVTFTFSTAPTGFVEADDVTVQNGALSGFTVTGDPAVYTATFTPTDNLEDPTNTISVGTGYTDGSGNTGTAGTSANYTIDTLAPTVAVTLSDSALGKGETSLVTFTFSEAPTGFAVGDVTADNGGLTLFTVTGNPLVYTATFTPTDSINDPTNTISVATTYTDGSGNTGTAGTSGNYTINTVAPSVAVTMGDNALSKGESTLVTFTFSTAPTGFVEADDVTVQNGALSGFTVTGDPAVYTATFTPTDNLEDPTNTISVGTGYTDGSGNTGTAGTSGNYTIDTLAPTVAVTLADAALSKGETSLVTFTFSEAPTGFAVGDVTADNGGLTLFTVTGNPLVYTATFTPTDSINDPSNVISVATTYTDGSGNTGTAGTSGNYTINTVAPSVAVTMGDNALSKGESTLVTFTFSTAPTGFVEADDVTVQNGALSGFTVTGDPAVYTATFTPTDNLEDPTNTISVGTGYTDGSGNTGTAGTSANYTIDTLAPTVAVTLSDSALGKGETSLVTFTFSEAPTGFAVGDVTADNGGLTLFTVTGNPLVYTATFTPTDSINDPTNTISVATTYTDGSGNTGTAGTSGNYTINTVAPSVAVTMGDNALSKGESTLVTFTFSTAPTGFVEADDVTVQNGALSGFTVTGDPAVYTATFTPTDNLEDPTNTISVGTGYTDGSGNTGTAGTSANYTIDTLAPTVAVTLSDSALGKGETSLVTFTFSEAPTGFAVGDVTADNGGLTLFTVTGNPLVYTATFTPTDSINDPSNVISVATTYTDGSGNTGTAGTSGNYTINTVAPSVAVTMGDNALSKGESTLVTFTFSTAPTGFVEADDVTVQNGALSGFTVTGDPAVYTATFTPTDNLEDPTNVISVGTGYTDGSGNTGTAGTSANYTIDTLAPTVAVTLSDSALGKGETSLVTFTFSEAPTGFAVGDVTADNGGLTLFTVTGNPLVYTATFTPTDSINDPSNVISVATTYTDGSGNTGTAGTSGNYTINTVAPSVAVTMGDNALSKGESTLVTFTFSTAPTGFVEADDVTVQNGALSGFTVTGDPAVYTATFTPTDNLEDPTNVISVGTGYTDGSGNTGTAGTSANYTIDTLAPTVAVTLADAALSKGETSLVTFTFSEAPTGFAVGDVTADNGGLTLFTVTGNPLVYTATFTPTDSINDPSNVISVATTYTDGSGNTGTAGTSGNYTINTVAPSVAVTMGDNALSKGESTLVTFTFSTAPTGFVEADDVTVQNGALSGFTVTGDPAVYTATFTPTDNLEDPTNTISVGTGYTDGSGNTGTAGTSANYTIDTLAPTVAVTLSDSALGKGETSLVTFTFSEVPTGFAVGDVTADNGGLTLFTVTGNPLVYTATFTPTDSINDPSNVISVATTYTDGSGNTGTAGTSGNYTINTVAPSVAVTMGDNALSKGESTLVTFTFSTAPTGFVEADDVTVQNGALSGFTVTGDPAVYTATFTPTDNLEDPTNTISVGTGYTDGSGNTGTAGTSANYTIDTLAPTVAVTLSDSALGKGETSLVTFTFSEVPTGFAVGDVTADNGGLTLFTVTGNPLVYTATFTPTDSINDPSNVISVATTYTDGSGNTGTAGTSGNYTINTVAPSVAVTMGDNALSKGESTLVTFTFSTAPTGFVEADDVTVQNGALSGFTVTGDPAVYTATFTPTDNLEDPTNVISVGTGYTDGSGNTGTAGTSANYTIDTLAPTVAVTLSDSALGKGETSLVTFTFSEAPTGFAVGDVTADNGGLTLFTVTGNPLVYTATFTPTDSINDPSNVISVATTYTDGSGNTGTAGTSGNYTINTVAPSVAVTMGDNALSKGESTLVTFTFSTAPTGFVEADDVTVQNGALSGFTVTGDPAVYTATFTPTDNLEDPTNVISVGTGYTDGSGNTGTAGTSANYTIDTLAPTVAVTLSDSALGKGETSLVTFTFSEAPTGFAVGDVTADNGGLTLFTVTGNPLVYTATFTPTDSINDPSNVISVATTYTDGSGNTGTAGTSGNYTINTVAPSVAVTMGDNALSKGESTLVTFTFSTAPTGFVEADDVTVQNGALSGFTVTGDPAVYTATFTPTDNLEDPTNTISVGTGYTDGSGNTGTAGTSANYTIDTLAPTVAVTLSDSALGKGETSLVTFTFSEAPTGFAVGDVTADNGGLTLFTVTGNPLVYTATFTPTDSINDPSNVISVATTYTDGSGNTGTAGTSGNYTINTVAPSVDIQGEPTGVNSLASFNVTIKFSNDVTGFIEGEIVLGNAARSNFIAVNGNTYTFDVTPTGAGDITIDVAAGVAQDGSGNDNTAASTATIIFDNTPPVVEITGSPDVNIANQSAVPISGTCTYGDSDVLVTITIGPLTLAVAPSPSCTPGGTWSASVDLSSPSISDGDNYIDIGAQQLDAFGNTGSATFVKISKDTVKPSVEIQNVPDFVNANEFTITIKFDEDVNGFDSSGITVTNGNINASSFIEVDAQTYTVGITADGAGDVTLNVAADVAQDLVGNDNNAATPVIAVYDITAPVVTISTPATVNAANDDSYTVGGSCENAEGNVLVAIAGAAPASKSVACTAGDVWTAVFDVTAVADGTNAVTINASQTDAATNIGNAVDTADKDVAIAVPTVDLLTTNSATPVITGTADADTALTIVVGGASYTLTATAGGLWILDTAVAIPDSGPFALLVGQNEVAVTSVDAAGNSANDASTNEVTLTVDDDNDGIPNSVECPAGPPYDVATCTDTDSDGTPDFLDVDSDNDLIPDATEAGLDSSNPIDSDGDGTPDYQDIDSDNDGINDIVEGAVDTDLDGIPDYVDVGSTGDSDGDGIPDSVECPVYPTDCADTNGDSTPDYLETDSDGDGIDDAVEAGIDPTSPIDTDGDGAPDYQDTDSDEDGTDDNTEGLTDADGDGIPDYVDVVTTGPGAGDSDGDGIADNIECEIYPLCPDSDGDGMPDYMEIDSDDDGIPDVIEAGTVNNDADNDGIDDTFDIDITGLVLGLDQNGDGIDDTHPLDTDGDGTPDYQDTDSDGDGISDLAECPLGGVLCPDADNDGIPDQLDASIGNATGNGIPGTGDSDGDGISDKMECAAGIPCPDVDQDGTPDYMDAMPNDGPMADNDNDGILNYLDPDDDNDNIPDVVEDPNFDGDDNPASNPLDSDLDGMPDYLETDSDNDGLSDAAESGASGNDSDGDNIDDSYDIDVTGGTDLNADGIDDDVRPLDSDGDSLPDYLDTDPVGDGSQDSDNDGIPDNVECPTFPTDCPDTDGDGTPDFLETDSDGDGIDDSDEKGSLDSGVLLDTDGDGIPDYQDLDSDGDGLPDATEGLDTDSDGDGLPDALDADSSGAPFGGDSDGDGVADMDECNSYPNCADSNNDGTPDYMDASSKPYDPDATINTALNGIGGNSPWSLLFIITALMLRRKVIQKNKQAVRK